MPSVSQWTKHKARQKPSQTHRQNLLVRRRCSEGQLCLHSRPRDDMSALVTGLSLGCHIAKTQDCTCKVGESFCLKHVSKPRLLKESTCFPPGTSILGSFSEQHARRWQPQCPVIGCGVEGWRKLRQSPILRLVLEIIHITVTHNSHCEGTKEHMHHLPIFANYHKMALSLSIIYSHSLPWERSAAYRRKDLLDCGFTGC